MRLLDTSALLEGEREGIILTCVIEELDRLKIREGKTGKKARDVIRFIYREAMGNIYDESDKYPSDKYPTADEILLLVAKEQKYELVTSDLSLFLRAKSQGISCNFVESDKNQYRIAATSTYLTDEEYCSLLGGTYETLHPENHFLIYGNEAYRILHGIPHKIGYDIIKNSIVGEIEPRNVEQKCFMNLLVSDVPVVAVHSKYGCGKSYLMLNYILSVIGKKFGKLVVVPNNSGVSDSREVGTLPGDILEKEFVYLGPIIDLLGKEEVRDMIIHEQLEVLPIAFARGRNLEDCIVFVSESQNLTDYHIKLLLGRMGENSRIFFDGDVRQEDSRVFTENSGLVLLHKLATNPDSAPLFGGIELKEIERSKVARLADLLDLIEG